MFGGKHLSVPHRRSDHLLPGPQAVLGQVVGHTVVAIDSLGDIPGVNDDIGGEERDCGCSTGRCR